MGQNERMHKIDFMKILPHQRDNYYQKRAEARQNLAKKIDFMELGPTFADKERRYNLARKVDVLDFGTFLGKSEAMQAIDFLEILPKPQKV